MLRQSSRLASESPLTSRKRLPFTLGFAGAPLAAYRSRHFTRTLALPVPLAIAMWCMPVAHAAGPLPQNGSFVQGQGAISGGPGSLTINQSSSRGVIDWHSFSIGTGNTVTFDNGSGTTLNRVTGGSPSAILGNLKATGSVYLVNPQGILVGRTGVISTGGRFVASTLDLFDTAFMNGGTLVLAGSSNGQVVNLGKISSSGGDIFLIAHDAVVNGGSVSAPNGTAEYVVGKQVVLYESSSSRQVFVQISSKGTVVDRGITQAAQINLEAADGNIYALAGSGSRIRATGTAMRDGHIWLVADNGHVTQQGTIAATNVDGSGGTVDTLANTLALQSGAAVQAGLWNVSTPNFTVDSATAGAFMRSLNAGTSVDAIATGTNGASGDLTVGSNLEWQGPASLSLGAFRNVTIAPATTLKNTGSGNLSLRADAAGIDNAGSVANQGMVDWSSSTGFVRSFYDMNGSYSPGTILANSAWKAGPYSGLLTQVTAYKLVNSLGDLRSVASDLAGNYALGKDIDASATSDGSYVPLGDINTPFTGQFDGQSKTVSSLTLGRLVAGDPASDGPGAMGMFGVIGEKGVVRDLSVNGNGHLGPSVRAYVGLLAGANYGTVVRDSASGNLNIGDAGPAQPTNVDETTAGGLVGGNFGTILRSSSAVVATTGGMLGGLVGENVGAIIQSYSTGALTSLGYTNEGAGGLVGYNLGSITQSYSTSPTLLQGYCRGSAGTPCGGAGLVVVNEGAISQSFATGLVTQPFYQPIGIARTNLGTITNDVYWNKDTTAATVGTVYGTPIPASSGLTTAQMSTPASFVSYDFGPAGVWAMPGGATHPVLRWQTGQ
jgi:filamentous hemagglutinin family protein